MVSENFLLEDVCKSDLYGTVTSVLKVNLFRFCFVLSPKIVAVFAPFSPNEIRFFLFFSFFLKVNDRKSELLLRGEVTITLK